jgi:hypothetical protein
LGGIRILDEVNENLKFSLSVSTDREKFLRRTCPSCGRDYKTEISDGNLAWILAPQFKQLGFEIGGTDEENVKSSDESIELCCPYCEEISDASDTLTDETLEYLKRYVTREYVLPQLRQAMSGLSTGRKKSAGLFSIEVSYSQSMLPPRPIHGPEPPDMKIIHMLCCNKRIKVSEGWNDVNVCTYCCQPVRVF